MDPRDARPGRRARQRARPPDLVHWEVATDDGFTRVVRRGRVRSDAASDHTVKVVVDGLEPYTRYAYRFRALGQTSPVGRTQTSPDEPGTTHALRLAFVSCSNFTGGFFTAYRGLAARDDLDLVLHLGDYVYEYGNTEDRYGPPALAGTRDHQPGTETVSLQDYRVRHALYKTDPDLQAAHAAHPWVVIFDDHEITNDAYATGAENHEEQDDPDTTYTGPGEPAGVRAEGDFLARRAEAFQAYLEWMPIREPGDYQPQPHAGTQFFRRFTFGDLAELSVVDTRQNRSQQVPALVGGVPNPALTDPARDLPEPEQLTWLTEGLTAGRTAWHLIGNQTVFARVLAAPQLGGLPGQVFNTDQWDGYQADQAAVLAAMAASGDTDPVVLTGDIHSSWANDLPTDHEAYGADRSTSVGCGVRVPVGDQRRVQGGPRWQRRHRPARHHRVPGREPVGRAPRGHRARLRGRRRHPRAGADRLLVHPQRRRQGPDRRPAPRPRRDGRLGVVVAVPQGQPGRQRAGGAARSALPTGPGARSGERGAAPDGWRTTGGRYRAHPRAPGHPARSRWSLRRACLFAYMAASATSKAASKPSTIVTGAQPTDAATPASARLA